MIKEKRRALLRILFCLVITVILGATLFSFVAFGQDYSDATTKAYEAELDRLVREQQEIENKLASIRENQSNAAEYGEYLSKQLSNLEDKIQVTQDLIRNLEESIKIKEAEIIAEGDNIDRTYRNFLERIRISYEEQNNSFLEVLLDSEGLAEMLARVERLNSLLDYDQRLKESYEAAKHSLERIKAELDESYAKLTLYKTQLDADIKSYESQIIENDNYISNLKDNEASEYAEYLRREEEREKLDKELEEYIQEMIAKSQEEYDGGQLSWPLPDECGRITCDYGYDVLYIYGIEQLRHHNGIDIGVVIGTPVYAAASGTVQIATYSSSYGYYMLIDHGSGVSTLYAHNSQLLFQPGDRVARGQIVAYSGNSGLSTGPHLHFEIRIGGTRVNPLEGNVLKTPKGMYLTPDA